jgi:hypothetical protein
LLSSEFTPELALRANRRWSDVVTPLVTRRFQKMRENGVAVARRCRAERRGRHRQVTLPTEIGTRGLHAGAQLLPLRAFPASLVTAFLTRRRSGRIPVRAYVTPPETVTYPQPTCRDVHQANLTLPTLECNSEHPYADQICRIVHGRRDGESVTQRRLIRRPNGTLNQLQAAPRASFDAARPLPRLTIALAEVICKGRDAVANE